MLIKILDNLGTVWLIHVRIILVLPCQPRRSSTLGGESRLESTPKDTVLEIAIVFEKKNEKHTEKPGEVE